MSGFLTDAERARVKRTAERVDRWLETQNPDDNPFYKPTKDRPLSIGISSTREVERKPKVGLLKLKWNEMGRKKDRSKVRRLPRGGVILDHDDPLFSDFSVTKSRIDPTPRCAECGTPVYDVSKTVGTRITGFRTEVNFVASNTFTERQLPKFSRVEMCPDHAHLVMKLPNDANDGLTPYDPPR